jgi:cytochrome d ubiquinol oxidase subunit I
MNLDPAFLSRLQFAWVIGWHILLPAFTVGAAAFIAVLEGFHLATGRDVYLRVSMFWIRIFSVAFGMGVVTGVVMPFSDRHQLEPLRGCYFQRAFTAVRL